MTLATGPARRLLDAIGYKRGPGRIQRETEIKVAGPSERRPVPFDLIVMSSDLIVIFQLVPEVRVVGRVISRAVIPELDHFTIGAEKPEEEAGHYQI